MHIAMVISLRTTDAGLWIIAASTSWGVPTPTTALRAVPLPRASREGG